MHPELVTLTSRYNAILDLFDSGKISKETASAQINELSAVDGDGFFWRIDTSTGGFLKSGPNTPQTPADPSEFSSFAQPIKGVSLDQSLTYSGYESKRPDFLPDNVDFFLEKEQNTFNPSRLGQLLEEADKSPQGFFQDFLKDPKIVLMGVALIVIIGLLIVL